jgi:uncharacterized damage-inducible protein DinB
MNTLSRPPRWTSRTFPGGMPAAFAPNVWARLAGTPARLDAAARFASDLKLASALATGWSIADQFGHLGDLEPLWLGRLDDYDAGETTLRAADITNRATTLAGHGASSLIDLARRFAVRRRELLARTSVMSPAEWERSSLHPRLLTPMRVIDFMAFVAEHDDHHLAEIAWLMSQGGVEMFDAR